MDLLSTSKPRALGGSYRHNDLQNFHSGFQPRKVPSKPNTTQVSTDSESTAIDIASDALRYEAPSPVSLTDGVAHTDATVIQIWEGTVTSVDAEKKEFRATIRATLGAIQEHTATFEFEWVNEQDFDLMQPGAVFYLTLYKNLKRGGTVVNSQELRFRRLPLWTSRQINSIKETAKLLQLKLKPKPLA